MTDTLHEPPIEGQPGTPECQANLEIPHRVGKTAALATVTCIHGETPGPDDEAEASGEAPRTLNFMDLSQLNSSSRYTTQQQRWKGQGRDDPLYK